jgi:hypothetical protein
LASTTLESDGLLADVDAEGFLKPTHPGDEAAGMDGAPGSGGGAALSS